MRPLNGDFTINDQGLKALRGGVAAAQTQREAAETIDCLRAENARLRAIESAARLVDRELLDRVKVHVCDRENDAVRRTGLVEPFVVLSIALTADQ